MSYLPRKQTVVPLWCKLDEWQQRGRGFAVWKSVTGMGEDGLAAVPRPIA